MCTKTGDLEDIWFYGYQHFGKVQADNYINHKSDIFRILSENSIDTPRSELGVYINALPFERHIIYFLQTDTDIIYPYIKPASEGWLSSQLAVTDNSH